MGRITRCLPHPFFTSFGVVSRSSKGGGLGEGLENQKNIVKIAQECGKLCLDKKDKVMGML